MALIVQKYGGTSVADIERLQNVAKRVAASYDDGNDLVVVLSAMAGVTQNLIDLAKQITEEPDPQELDSLLSTGEQQTVTILAMILKKMGYPAKSLLAFQAGIKSSNDFGNARILDIDADKIFEVIKNGGDKRRIVIVAGFQGVDANFNITTLGRGGSDTTAVALAAGLKADICEIYTDVDGIYTADPRICRKARKLKAISYDDMLELSSLGAKVLQIRSVGFAKKYNVKLIVRSSFSQEEGTMLVDEKDKNMEKLVVAGVVCDRDQARITIKKVPDEPGISARIFKPISDAKIVVDMIIQNTRAEGKTDLTFTVPKKDYKPALQIAEDICRQVQGAEVVSATHVAKVSVVGVGMKNHSGVAAKMFTALAEKNINIRLISTSEIRISCIILEEYVELAVRTLHEAFGLDVENDNNLK